MKIKPGRASIRLVSENPAAQFYKQEIAGTVISKRPKDRSLRDFPINRESREKRFFRAHCLPVS